MTLVTPDDKHAENLLLRHFAQYRIGGDGKERFAISLSRAVSALVELRLLGEGQQVLELPEIAPIHPDYAEYLRKVRNLKTIDESAVIAGWSDEWQFFLKRRELMSVDEMVDESEAEFQKILEELRMKLGAKNP